jgi:hypothetical protein
MGGGWREDVLDSDSLRKVRGVWVMVLRAVVVREMGRKALAALFRRARADMMCVVFGL